MKVPGSVLPGGDRGQTHPAIQGGAGSGSLPRAPVLPPLAACLHPPASLHAGREQCPVRGAALQVEDQRSEHEIPTQAGQILVSREVMLLNMRKDYHPPSQVTPGCVICAV